VDAKVKQQRCSAVAQVVEANPRQPGPRWQRIELRCRKLEGQGPAHGVREDEPMVVQGEAEQVTLLMLPGNVAGERAQGRPG
jgi:hypothetical protein